MSLVMTVMIVMCIRPLARLVHFISPVCRLRGVACIAITRLCVKWL